MRAGVLPRWSGLFVIIGVALFFLGEVSFLAQRLAGPAVQGVFGPLRSLRVLVLLGDGAFGLGVAWMGYAVWSEKRSIA
jgi:hypothetical protein